MQRLMRGLMKSRNLAKATASLTRIDNETKGAIKGIACSGGHAPPVWFGLLLFVGLVLRSKRRSA